MANTFKNAALTNVNNAALQTLYTAPAATTTVILGMSLANKSSSEIQVTLEFTDSSGGVSSHMLSQVPIPENTTLEVLSGQKYILEPNDSLKLQSSTAASLDVVVGLMEIT